MNAKVDSGARKRVASFAWHWFALFWIWGLIFLPGLGGPEYKGEEPRRVQPAIAMLDTGEWIVPHIGGKPYYNKPPLINWLVAASFSIAGERTEGAARAVSVVAVLILALAIYGGCRGWMGPSSAFISAVVAITHASMLDKGRLIEIEPLYMALFGVALVLWVAEWAKGERSRPVVQWLAAFFFLGLGILAKGPLHLMFFYGTIIAILWHGRALRELCSLWHAGGVIVMCGVAAAWMIPFFARTSGDKALGAWRGQMSSRIAGEEDRLVSWEWLLNLPKGLANFLPWTLLLVVLVWLFVRRVDRPAPADSDRKPAIGSGMLFALALFSMGLGAIPGILPRYTMP
ncbi:MAG: glycosyltransferase family 39 protein, partial [Verrucomicrobiia bacterium]